MTNQVLSIPSRIMIFGRPGSGKSTFALRLSKLINIPLYHLDRYFFTYNWLERNYQEFLSLQKAIVDQEKWIIDGNSAKSLEMRYARAELAIYLNYPRWKCYFRVFKRLLKKDLAIHDRAEGCMESIRWSLLSYMWHCEKRFLPLIQIFQQRYPKVKFVEIQNDMDLRRLETELLL